jgi:hypothetical protein
VEILVLIRLRSDTIGEEWLRMLINGLNSLEIIHMQKEKSKYSVVHTTINTINSMGGPCHGFCIGLSRKKCGNDSIFVIVEIFSKVSYFISYKILMMPTWFMNISHFILFF